MHIIYRIYYFQVERYRVLIIQSSPRSAIWARKFNICFYSSSCMLEKTTFRLTASGLERNIRISYLPRARDAQDGATGPPLLRSRRKFDKKHAATAAAAESGAARSRDSSEKPVRTKGCRGRRPQKKSSMRNESKESNANQGYDGILICVLCASLW